MEQYNLPCSIAGLLQALHLTLSRRSMGCKTALRTELLGGTPAGPAYGYVLYVQQPPKVKSPWKEYREQQGIERRHGKKAHYS